MIEPTLAQLHLENELNTIDRTYGVDFSDTAIQTRGLDTLATDLYQGAKKTTIVATSLAVGKLTFDVLSHVCAPELTSALNITEERYVDLLKSQPNTLLTVGLVGYAVNCLYATFYCLRGNRNELNKINE